MEEFNLLTGRQQRANNFKDDWLDWSARASLSLQLSRRRYDKVVCLAVHLEK